jgi:endonuclease/exonuclease/phosphatase family metal-dependent hydrolase
MPHIKEQSYPTILMGDFNNEWQDQFKQALHVVTNARDVAKEVHGPLETRTEFGNKKLVAIDHILVKNVHEVTDHTTIKEVNGIYASDHRPVITTIVI